MVGMNREEVVEYLVNQHKDVLSEIKKYNTPPNCRPAVVEVYQKEATSIENTIILLLKEKENS